MSAPLHVRCPSCVAEYALPESLMGPHGARVACPACGTRFSVARPATATDANGARLEPAPPEDASRGTPRDPEPPRLARDDAAPSEASAAGRSERPLGIAESCLTALDPDRERMLAAAASGRLMAEFGPALLDAFDAYRRAAGAAATREAFARALRARTGVSLPLAEGEVG